MSIGDEKIAKTFLQVTPGSILLRKGVDAVESLPREPPHASDSRFSCIYMKDCGLFKL